MTSATGITQGTAGVVTTQAAVAPASVVNAHAAAAKVAASSTSQNVSISPRIIDDPTAGIITQFLDSSGKIASQFPSTTVVAYLRAGLTSEGLSRHPAENSVHRSTTA